MKAEELFIGSIVRVNRDGLCIKKDTIVEVRAIDADYMLIGKELLGSTRCRPLDDNQFDGGIWCEHLEPIHLTPELLEKNGFSAHQFWHEYKEGNVVIQACIPSIRMKNGPYELEIKEGVHYVHQLQRALRLCGIDKEIEL